MLLSPLLQKLGCHHVFLNNNILNSILNTFRLILAKGADPNALDTNGNNVCHMMVILNKRDMFDMAFETGADARIFNNQVRW